MSQTKAEKTAMELAVETARTAVDLAKDTAKTAVDLAKDTAKTAEALGVRVSVVETQRAADVQLNTEQHTAIRKDTGEIKAILCNHLKHIDRWLWVLISGFILAIIPYVVYVAIEIVKHVWLAQAVVK